MKPVYSISAVVVAIVLAATPCLAQDRTGVWRDLAATLDPGARIVLHLDDGTRVKATFVRATDTHMTIVPRTRVPVPPQDVAFTSMERLERDSRSGVHLGKAVAIGAASGAGAFLGMMLLMIAAYAD
jgi:hypothetical protein